MYKITNRPPHVYADNEYYFITSRTIKGISFWDSESRRRIWKNVLAEGLKRFDIKIFAWVLLPNHYHLLMHAARSNDLPKFISNINSNSARLLNKYNSKLSLGLLKNFEENKRKLVLGQSSRVWWNYWDRCIRDEKDFIMHFNYIHHNPIKHGLVKNADELSGYGFSSYNSWLKREGEEFLTSIFYF